LEYELGRKAPGTHTLSEKNTRRNKSVEALVAVGDFEGVRNRLTVLQRRWCEEFLLDFDATKAARRAGYKAKDIHKQAYQLLHHTGCTAYREYLEREARKDVEGNVLDKEYVVKKALAGIQSAQEKGNLSAYFRGLELLARHLGMFVDKTEISGPDGEAIKIEQQAREEAENLISTLQKLSKKEITLL
jgi:phage terminase small subunit